MAAVDKTRARTAWANACRAPCHSQSSTPPEDGAHQGLHCLLVQLAVVHPLVKHVVKPARACECSMRREGTVLQPWPTQQQAQSHARAGLNVWRSTNLVRSTLTLGSFTYRQLAAASHSSTSLSLRSSSCGAVDSSPHAGCTVTWARHRTACHPPSVMPASASPHLLVEGPLAHDDPDLGRVGQRCQEKRHTASTSRPCVANARPAGNAAMHAIYLDHSAGAARTPGACTADGAGESMNAWSEKPSRSCDRVGGAM